jgi:hypothetical protein
MFAMVVPFSPSIPAAGDAHRRQVVLDAGAVDPVGEVGARAGEADHLPGRGVLVAAVDGVAEIALLGVLQQEAEEVFSAHAVERDAAGLQALEHVVLLRGRELREGLAGELLAAVGVGGRDARAVHLARRHLLLVAEQRRHLDEGALHVPGGRMAEGALHLPVDERYPPPN